MSAEIIPFRRKQPVQGPPDDGARLVRALKGLESALAEQRAAVAEWRRSLATLQTTMRGVGEGLHRYRDSLGRLHDDVTTLNGQAVQLERWADSVLVATPAARGG